MTPFVWKQGFPAATPEQDATRQAVVAVKAYYAGRGGIVADTATRIVRTPDHDAAGEYLVRVTGMYTVDGGV